MITFPVIIADSTAALVMPTLHTSLQNQTGSCQDQQIHTKVCMYANLDLHFTITSDLDLIWLWSMDRLLW